MKNSTAVFTSVLCFLTGSLFGIVLGFLVSPVKRGFGNYISHTTHIYGSDKHEQSGAPRSGTPQKKA